MKKVIILNASPNDKGSTAYLTDIFMSECHFNTTVYNMYDEAVAPCNGCDYCIERQECTIQDDVQKIIGDILSSDYVIFASPVYNYSFPSPMKAFLDRLQPLFFKEKSTTNRKGFLLASCGKSGKFSVDVMEKQCKMAFSELSTEFCGSYFFTDTDKKNTLQNEEICKVRQLAYTFFNSAF